MTAQELIQYRGHQVRRDSDLMAFYLEIFKAYFDRLPNCAGCTFNKDWERLKAAIQNTPQKNINFQKKLSMESVSKEYELKVKNNDILTYRKNNRPHRIFASRMNDDFAKEFLTHGTPEQIEQRKKLFKRLPSEVEESEEKELSDMSRKELNKLAEEKGLNPKDYKNKVEIIEAIEKV